MKRREFSSVDDDLTKVANRNSILIPVVDSCETYRPIETICKHGRRISPTWTENQDGKPLNALTLNPHNPSVSVAVSPNLDSTIR